MNPPGPLGAAWATVLLGLAALYLSLVTFAFVGLFRRDPRPPRHAAAHDEHPSVSVIVPARNEEATLAPLLTSLSAQRYPGRCEFVVVDDRSEDGTADVVRRFCALDPRFRLLRIRRPHPLRAPKVHAVATGVEASSGEVILATDADCRMGPFWVRGMVDRFRGGACVVVGYVSTTEAGQVPGPVARFETIDWLSLMLVSRALARHGFGFASSANNQGYLRSALRAVGGFGAISRAPSGDEDLLVQRLASGPEGRIAFADEPEVRVVTRPVGGALRLFHQRRRWVSRYHHLQHYRPAFYLGVATLGAHSVVWSLSAVLSPLAPWLWPYLAGILLLQTALQTAGVAIGARQLGRRDLVSWGLLAWAALHPLFIASVVIGSFVRSGEWRAGARSYRRIWWRRRVDVALRRLRLRPRRGDKGARRAEDVRPAGR